MISLSCLSCHNEYHLRKKCTRLENKDFNRVTKEIYKCYQCLEDCILLHHLDNNDFETSLINLKNILTQRDSDRLSNLILIPFKISQNNNRHDDVFHPDKILFNKETVERRYYLPKDFSNLVGNKQIVKKQLSFFHLNIRSYRNKFDALTKIYESVEFPFYSHNTYRNMVK